MTPEEARKLLGGYATGSLSEAERTALFQAALEDQELFDELAGEQVLKEVLDEPGARQRLIAVLEPPRKHRAWLWAMVAATAAVAVVIGIVVSQRTPPPPPQQIARVMKSSEPAEAPVAAPVPVLKAVKPKVAPALTAPVPPPPPIAESSKDLQKEDLQKAESENKLADQVQQTQPVVAPQAAPPAAAGAVRQFAAARVATVFGFSYAVGADGFLVITPTALGFLSVTNNDSVIAPSAAVPAGTPVRIAIPSGATSLVIAFSMTPGITGAPVRRDGASGTVTDQDPPNGKILIQLFLTPVTR
ncbi:MAG: hypothetical protein LAP61_29560 [Acidobacteriia bacterium]|nr:hypothetical protein [Terriglobia bacterium]